MYSLGWLGEQTQTITENLTSVSDAKSLDTSFVNNAECSLVRIRLKGSVFEKSIHCCD